MVPGLLLWDSKHIGQRSLSMSLAKSGQPGTTMMNTLPVTEQNDGRRDLTNDVRKFVLDSFPLARKRRIQDSDALLEGGIIDSQGVLEVVAFIERRFSTTVDDEELVPENFQTIDRITAFIASKHLSQEPGSGMK
jgi:acyl carrier protein